MKSVLYILPFLFASFLAYAQTDGCTDPQAINFNPNATHNDGSCIYNATFYNPQVQAILSAELAETSGLIYYNGAFWTHNDSGGDPKIYKLDTASAAVLQEIMVNNATNIDWEDLAQDEEHMYIGDFGNNFGNRDDLRIYVIEKSQIPDSGHAEVEAAVIDFYYEDQDVFRVRKRLNNFDCEAMIVIDDRIYLFSKNWQNEHTKLYLLPVTSGIHSAKKIAEFDIKGLVTGADYQPTLNEITLCGYKNKLWVPFIFLLYDYKGQDLLSGNKRRIDFPTLVTSQTEGICYQEGKHIFISAEKTQTVDQALYKLNTGIWTNIPPLGMERLVSGTISLGIHPNPVKKKYFTISINNLPESLFELTILDSTGRTILLRDYSLFPGQREMKIKVHTGSYRPGIYMVKLRSGNNFTTRKVVIQ